MQRINGIVVMGVSTPQGHFLNLRDHSFGIVIARCSTPWSVSPNLNDEAGGQGEPKVLSAAWWKVGLGQDIASPYDDL